VAIRRAKILDGLQAIIPQLEGKDREFIEHCVQTGNIEVSAQICGITDPRPWLRVSRLKLRYGKATDGRASLYHPKNTLRERQLKRAVDKLYGKLENISDPKVLLRAIETITHMEERAPEGGAVASIPQIGVTFNTTPDLCPRCGFDLRSDSDATVEALRTGGKVLDTPNLNGHE